MILVSACGCSKRCPSQFGAGRSPGNFPFARRLHPSFLNACATRCSNWNRRATKHTQYIHSIIHPAMRNLVVDLSDSRTAPGLVWAPDAAGDKRPPWGTRRQAKFLFTLMFTLALLTSSCLARASHGTRAGIPQLPLARKRIRSPKRVASRDWLRPVTGDTPSETDRQIRSEIDR